MDTPRSDNISDSFRVTRKVDLLSQVPAGLFPDRMLTEIVETNLGAVEYTEAGTGAPVLYFHGTGVTGAAMLPFESRLVHDRFRLLLPNRPGYGRTPLAPNTSATDCAHVAASLLDALGIDTVSVMGSSGGAAFATSFAINHGHRVKSLVLLCPQLHRWNHQRWLPVSSRWTLPFLQRPVLRKVLLQLYRMQLPRMGVKQLLKMEAGERYSEFVEDRGVEKLCRSALAAMTHGTRHPGFGNDLTIFTDEDIIESDEAIEAPTLVIHDPSDPMAPVAHVDWFATKVPHCQRVSVHTAGHLIWAGPDADLMHQTRVGFLRRPRKQGV